MFGVIPDKILILSLIKNLTINGKSSLYNYSSVFDNNDFKSINNAKNSLSKVGVASSIIKNNLPIKLKLEGINFDSIKVSYDGYLFDLDASMLIDALLLGGFQQSHFNGDFIFAYVNKKLKLIPVDSIAYKACTESTRISKIKDLSKSVFIPGHIYKNKNNKTFLFAGKINSYKISEVDDKFSYELNKKTNLLCFIRYDKTCNLDNFSIHDVMFTTSPKFIEDVSCIDIKEDLFGKIKKMSRDFIMEILVNINNGVNDLFSLKRNIEYYSIHLNLFKNLEDEEIFNIKQFLSIL